MQKTEEILKLFLCKIDLIELFPDKKIYLV